MFKKKKEKIIIPIFETHPIAEGEKGTCIADGKIVANIGVGERFVLN